MVYMYKYIYVYSMYIHIYICVFVNMRMCMVYMYIRIFTDSRSARSVVMRISKKCQSILYKRLFKEESGLMRVCVCIK